MALCAAATVAIIWSVEGPFSDVTWWDPTYSPTAVEVACVVFFYGTSVLAVCAASCAYHAAQVLHGTGSAPAAKFCTIDTILAVATALTFTWSVHIEPTNVAFALLSLAFFKDTFGLGYTTSHSLWHFSTAGAAMVSRRRHSNA